MDKKYSILINTCDAYCDAWGPFFRILEKTWPSAKNYNIYLNTESKQYNDSFFNVTVLNCIDGLTKISWGERLLNALSRIDSEYILFMLEDFFFEDKVDWMVIDRCIAYMEENERIASICFTSPMECSDSDYCNKMYNSDFPDFVIRKQRAYYKYDASPSLWRKSKLIKCTFKKDTPWEWEFFGNMRTWCTKDVFYGRISTAPRVFDYDIIHGGAIHRGKWVGYKMRELKLKYSIDFDMSEREIIEDWMKEPSCTMPLPRSRRLGSIIKNRVQAVISVMYSIFIGRFK